MRRHYTTTTCEPVSSFAGVINEKTVAIFEERRANEDQGKYVIYTKRKNGFWIKKGEPSNKREGRISFAKGYIEGMVEARQTHSIL